MTRDEAVKIANKTSRTAGAVGRDPICYRWVRDRIDKRSRILDYGAGKDAVHAGRLRDLGYDTVVAYEIGDNFNAATHTAEPEENAYDVVIASNVLNVIPDVGMLRETVEELYHYTIKNGGIIVFNLPDKPRKLDMIEPMVITFFLVISGLRPHKVAKNLWVLDTEGGKHD